jgi:hypothetical protein
VLAGFILEGRPDILPHHLEHGFAIFFGEEFCLEAFDGGVALVGE